MAERWKLCRAGITNVYQYADEVLRFGGGRLLLRGVNGSGKSTAMNMLLPFLLDADVRKIDAAGDQAGVLRSWMLSGRDETQPTGYLWVEVVRGDDHLTFGCGIKANRNTSNVSHWWFITERRPGIDLQLVRRHGTGARTPLSAEELRAEIGPEHVWSMDQRAAYRAALRGRLFGGADLQQHIRLLHIVRNPRVGDRVDDRIDLGLTAHLHDALPQLSEAAIDDAATPLEQLEEHRRNVSDLAGTVDTLQALLATYRAHARSELRARADDALAHVGQHRRREQAAAEAVEEEASARSAVGALEGTIRELASDEERLGREITQLESSEAYSSASDLALRREMVVRLEEEARQAARLADAQAGVAADDRDDVSTQEVAVGRAGSRLHEDLTALSSVVAEARLTVAVPGQPEVAVAPLAVGTDVVSVPASGVPVDDIGAGLARVRAAAQFRTDEVAEAMRALDRVQDAFAQVQEAEGALGAAQGELDSAGEAAADAAEALASAAERWRSRAVSWIEDLHAHTAQVATAPHLPIDLSEADVAADHEHLQAALVEAVDAVLHVHRTTQATAEGRLRTAEETRAGAQQEVDELAGRDVPDPPAAPWQAPRSGPCLAEVVDFDDALAPDERAGLEAALEASGLLMAEVRPDGALAVGDLLVRPGERAAAPLGRLLTVSVPSEHPDLPAEAVSGVLAAISTGVDDLGRAGTTTVTTSGEFRIGPLRGRHAKAQAEHVGVTARRAALERMRAEAATRLAEAELGVEQAEAALSRALADVAAATDLRSSVPSTAPVVAAGADLAAAERRRTAALGRRDRARGHRDDAERHHGLAVDAARRMCATAGLPHERAALATIRDACRSVPGLADTVGRSAAQLVSAVGHWTSAGERWARSRQAADDAHERARAKRDEHGVAAAELATLEDAIGLDVREVLATLEHAKGELKAATTGLRRAREKLGPARQRLGTCEAEVGRTRDAVDASERAGVTLLGRLRAALAVPGLWAAARAEGQSGAEGEPGEENVHGDDGRSRDADRERDPVPAGLPVVEASTGGLDALATALRERVPTPEQAVSHDGVRSALLQRRAALGAGWDAVSRHPELDLPLAVEVTGPLGQMPLPAAAAAADEQLRSKRGLLSAQQTEALRNLLQGLVAKEVAEKLHAARELVDGMNERLREVRTTHGIGTSLRWRRRDDLSDDLSAMVDLLARPPDLRTGDDDARLVKALSARIAEARADDPEADYRTLIARVLDYREWHRMQVVVHRPGVSDAVLSRRTPLSEGEKKIVSYQPLFAAVAASCDALAEAAPDAPRFVLLDDAFAKVSEDNHPKLFGLLVDLDLDFIATSERLWGTHATVPELAITEVVRDADAGVIVLEHSHWDGRTRTEVP